MYHLNTRSAYQYWGKRRIFTMHEIVVGIENQPKHKYKGQMRMVS